MISRTRMLAGGLTALLVSVGLVVGAPGIANAHHPVLGAKAACDTATGQLNIKLEAVSDAPTRGKYWQLNTASPSLDWQLGKQNRRNESNSFTASLPAVTVAKTYDFSVSASWFMSMTTDAVNVGPISGVASVTVTKAMLDNCKPADVKNAKASLSTTPATCTAPETLVYGVIEHATWSGTPDGTQGPGSYHVVATGDAGPPQSVFDDGSKTKVFDGALSDKLDPNDHPECRSLQPPDVTRHQTERGCDLTAYGDFLPGAIGRTGKEAYVWSPELRDWVLSGVVAWDPWFQITVWGQHQLVTHGCVAAPVVKPKGSITTSCKGQVAFTLDTTRNVNASSVFRLRVNKGSFHRAKVITLKAGTSRYIVWDVPNGARATLKYKGHVKHARVPAACGTPDTGERHAPAVSAKQAVRDFSSSRLSAFARL